MKTRYEMPRYMERFRCIGPACEDTCCAWWGISVDRRAYDRYRSTGGRMTGIAPSRTSMSAGAFCRSSI